MGTPRVLAAVAVGAQPPVPVYHGTALAVASYWIANGIATVTLTPALPKTGFEGPRFDLGTTGGGKQITLWGFTTGTYFNALTVTVLDNDGANSFRFYTTHAAVASAASPQADTTGFAAAVPFQHYRAVRIECGPAIGTDYIYVGDLNVSATRYMARLSLAGQLAIEIASENIPADRIFVTGTSAEDTVQVTLIY